MVEKGLTGQGRVAVLRTSPETVLEDYARLMHLAEYERFLPKDRETILKINISWQRWYPACSTPPWQLEGVIKTLLADGYPRQSLVAVHNRTPVVNAKVGEVNNRQKPVVEKYGLRNVHIYEPQYRWVKYEPKEPFLALHKVYPKGFYIPEFLIGKNIVHLPQVKTHVYSTTTGAMKNAFGGLIGDLRHYTHSFIHEVLVDLLTVQRDIHPGLFAVMDGAFAGDGPGPRCMIPHIKNLILASADQVAIDAIAAKMMGFDPLSLDYIRLAHERGLGVGDPRQIEVVGEDISGISWGFQVRSTLASRGARLLWFGPLKRLQTFILRGPITIWAYLASRLYHDVFWYNLVGRKRVEKALQTDWGKLFLSYG